MRDKGEFDEHDEERALLRESQTKRKETRHHEQDSLRARRGVGGSGGVLRRVRGWGSKTRAHQGRECERV